MIYHDGSRIRYAFIGEKEIEDIRDSTNQNINFLKFLLLNIDTLVFPAEGGNSSNDIVIDTNCKNYILN